MRALLKTLTGSKDEELGRVISSFCALTLLLMSYYVLKPLRSSYFLMEFDPEWLPRFYLLMPIFSLLATRVFNFFYIRLERFPLIAWTYGIIIFCKVTFMILLTHPSRAIIVVFYFFTTVYFLLCMSVMWACLSTIFNALAGERTFAFISFGGMIGAWLGSELSSSLGQSAYKDLALLASAGLMASALVFLRYALTHSPRAAAIVKTEESTSKRSWIADFREIWSHRYLRAIALMVFALAFMNTVLDFVSSRVIDEKLAQREYQEHFSDLPEPGFEFIYGLKEVPESTRRLHCQRWLEEQKVEIPVETLLERYQGFRETHETDVRVFYSKCFRSLHSSN